MWKNIMGKSGDSASQSGSGSRQRKTSEGSSHSKRRTTTQSDAGSVVSSSSPSASRKHKDRDGHRERDDDGEREKSRRSTSRTYTYPVPDEDDKSRRSTSRTYTYPVPDESVASTYATAPSSQPQQRERGAVEREEKLKRRATMDDDRPYYYENANQQSWENDEGGKIRERGDKPSSSIRRERSRSLDREDRRKERRERREKDDTPSQRRTGTNASDRGLPTRSDPTESTRAGEPGTFSAQVTGGGFSQFPGQEGAPSTNYATGDSHIAHQFPGPLDNGGAPFRPVAGAAAEFYGDMGESVLRQPGVRPKSPMVNAQPHLMAASAAPAPPVETGSGAADDYFTGVVGGAVAGDGGAASTKPASGKIGRPSPKPSKTGGGKISSAAALAGGAAVAYGATHSDVAGPSAWSQNHDDITAASSYTPGISGLASYQVQQSSSLGHSLSALNGGGSLAVSSGQSPRHSPSQSPSRPSKSHLGSYAAGAAGLAAGAYALHGHHDHEQHQHSHVHSQSAGSNLYGSASYGGASDRPPMQNGHSSYMAQEHRHRGPVTKVVDWWKDHEDVRKMEEYTEYIGVCRDCFDPRTSVYDAPRKHHYRKRKSRESLKEKRSGEFRRSSEYLPSGRITKDSRYYGRDSSDNESRRKSNKGNWVAGGLAAYGLAKAGKALVGKGNDFDDTYSVKSGRRYSSRKDRSRNSSRERKSITSHGVIRRRSNSLDRKSHVTGSMPGSFVDVVEGHQGDYRVERRRSKRNGSRSTSRDRTSGVLGAAAGAALAGSAITVSSRHRSRSNSPQKEFVRVRHGSHRGSEENVSVYGSADYRRHGSRNSLNSRSSRDDVSTGGVFGFFGGNKRRKAHAKKRKGFFTFGNGSSSSSSSDVGLAYGGDIRRDRRQNKMDRKPKRQSSDEKLKATVLGIGATAAALALAQGKGKGKHGDVVAVRQRRAKHQTRGALVSRPGATSDSVGSDDEGWESAADDSSSMESSGLAYGDFKARNSTDSLASNDSGTWKWGWRWGGQGPKKKKRQSTESLKQHYMTPAIVSGAVAGAAAAGTMDALSNVSSSQQSLQNVYPVPTDDPGRFDVIRRYDSNQASGQQQPLWTSRPGDVPLQQPQPIAQVSDGVYGTHAPPYSPGYVAPTGPPVDFSAVVTGKSSKRNSLERRASDRKSSDNERISSSARKGRRASSPAQSNLGRDAAIAGVATAAGVAAVAGLAGGGRNPSKDVRFDLQDEKSGREKTRGRRRREEEEARIRREEEDRAHERRRREEEEQARLRQEESRARERARREQEEQARLRKEESQARERKRRDEEEQFRLREEESRARERRKRDEAIAAAARAEEERRADLEREAIRQHQEREAEHLQREREDAARETAAREASAREAAVREEAYRAEQDRIQGDIERREARDAREAEMKRDREREATEAETKDREKESWAKPVAAGVAGAVTAAAVASYVGSKAENGRKERDEDSNKRGYAYDEQYPPTRENQPREVEPREFQQTREVEPQVSESKVVDYVPKVVQIAPSNVQIDSSFDDDVIFDPDYFKKKKNKKEAMRQSDLAMKQYSIMTHDLEERYNAPPVSPEEFFAPDILKDHSSTERKIDANADADIHVYHVPDIGTLGGPPYNKPYSFTATKDGLGSSWAVPALNLIEPTPPGSRSASVSGDHSAPPSPVGRGREDEEADEELERESSGSRVTWGEDQTFHYDVPTPESYRQQFVSVQDLGTHAQGDTELSQDHDEIIVEVDDEDEGLRRTTYKPNIPTLSTSDTPTTSISEATASRDLPTQEVETPIFESESPGVVPVVVSPDEARMRGNPVYQNPYFETVSDLGFDVGSSSQPTPRHPGFVEELADTPMDERPTPQAMPDTPIYDRPTPQSMPGGFTDDEPATPMSRDIPFTKEPESFDSTFPRDRDYDQEREVPPVETREDSGDGKPSKKSKKSKRRESDRDPRDVESSVPSVAAGLAAAGLATAAGATYAHSKDSAKSPERRPRDLEESIPPAVNVFDFMEKTPESPEKMASPPRSSMRERSSSRKREDELSTAAAVPLPVSENGFDVQNGSRSVEDSGHTSRNAFVPHNPETTVGAEEISDDNFDTPEEKPRSSSKHRHRSRHDDDDASTISSIGGSVSARTSKSENFYEDEKRSKHRKSKHREERDPLSRTPSYPTSEPGDYESARKSKRRSSSKRDGDIPDDVSIASTSRSEGRKSKEKEKEKKGGLLSGLFGSSSSKSDSKSDKSRSREEEDDHERRRKKKSSGSSSRHAESDDERRERRHSSKSISDSPKEKRRSHSSKSDYDLPDDRIEHKRDDEHKYSRYSSQPPEDVVEDVLSHAEDDEPRRKSKSKRDESESFLGSRAEDESARAAPLPASASASFGEIREVSDLPLRRDFDMAREVGTGVPPVDVFDFMEKSEREVEDVPPVDVFDFTEKSEREVEDARNLPALPPSRTTSSVDICSVRDLPSLPFSRPTSSAVEADLPALRSSRSTSPVAIGRAQDLPSLPLSRSTSPLVDADLPSTRPGSPYEEVPVTIGSIMDLPSLPLSCPTSPAVEADLPATRPGSPYEEEPETHAKTPPRPSLESLRKASTTTVPLGLALRFGRGPGSPSLPRDVATGPLSSGSSSQSPMPYSPLSAPKTRHHHSHSSEINKEYRPLYLLESNRKTPDIEETLPALPESTHTSRTPSAHESDAGFESAVESPEASFHEAYSASQSPEASFHEAHESKRDFSDALSYEKEDDYLDSQQVTPKAATFPANVMDRDGEHSPKDRSGSPFDDTPRKPTESSPSRIGRIAAAAGVAGLAGFAAHELLSSRGYDSDFMAASGDEGDKPLKEKEASIAFTPSREDATPTRPTLMRAPSSTSKKGKKGKRGSRDIGSLDLSGPPAEMTPEELQLIRERDAKDAVESWFGESSPVVDDRKVKKGKRRGSSRSSVDMTPIEEKKMYFPDPVSVPPTLKEEGHEMDKEGVSFPEVEPNPLLLQRSVGKGKKKKGGSKKASKSGIVFSPGKVGSEESPLSASRELDMANVAEVAAGSSEEKTLGTLEAAELALPDSPALEATTRDEGFAESELLKTSNREIEDLPPLPQSDDEFGTPLHAAVEPHMESESIPHEVENIPPRPQSDDEFGAPPFVATEPLRESESRSRELDQVSREPESVLERADPISNEPEAIARESESISEEVDVPGEVPIAEPSRPVLSRKQSKGKKGKKNTKMDLWNDDVPAESSAAIEKPVPLSIDTKEPGLPAEVPDTEPSRPVLSRKESKGKKGKKNKKVDFWTDDVPAESSTAIEDLEKGIPLPIGTVQPLPSAVHETGAQPALETSRELNVEEPEFEPVKSGKNSKKDKKKKKNLVLWDDEIPAESTEPTEPTESVIGSKHEVPHSADKMDTLEAITDTKEEIPLPIDTMTTAEPVMRATENIPLSPNTINPSGAVIDLMEEIPLPIDTIATAESIMSAKDEISLPINTTETAGPVMDAKNEISLPIEAVSAAEPIEPEQEPASESTHDIDIEIAIAQEEEPVFESLATGKKSRKDKKKKKNLAWEDEIQSENIEPAVDAKNAFPPPIDTLDTAEPIPAAETDQEPIVGSSGDNLDDVQEAEPEFESVAAGKKSKKDKKKKNIASWEDELPAESTETAVSAKDEIPLPVDTLDTTEPTPSVETDQKPIFDSSLDTNVIKEAESGLETIATGKKSKKDKKKKKNSVSWEDETPANSAPPTPDVQAELPPTIDTVNPPLAADPDQEPPVGSRDTSISQETEPEFETFTVGKRSKKDKKKKKNFVSWDDEHSTSTTPDAKDELPLPIDTVIPTPTDELALESLEDPSAHVNDVPEPEQEPDFESFSTGKKSKKDKKKKHLALWEDDISTEAAGIAPNMEDELPRPIDTIDPARTIEPEQESTPVLAPDADIAPEPEQGPDFEAVSTSKKSKKDKKKKKGFAAWDDEPAGESSTASTEGQQDIPLPINTITAPSFTDIEHASIPESSRDINTILASEEDFEPVTLGKKKKDKKRKSVSFWSDEPLAESNTSVAQAQNDSVLPIDATSAPPTSESEHVPIVESSGGLDVDPEPVTTAEKENDKKKEKDAALWDYGLPEPSADVTDTIPLPIDTADPSPIPSIEPEPAPESFRDLNVDPEISEDFEPVSVGKKRKDKKKKKSFPLWDDEPAEPIADHTETVPLAIDTANPLPVPDVQSEPVSDSSRNIDVVPEAEPESETFTPGKKKKDKKKKKSSSSWDDEQDEQTASPSRAIPLPIDTAEPFVPEHDSPLDTSREIDIVPDVEPDFEPVSTSKRKKDKKKKKDFTLWDDEPVEPAPETPEAIPPAIHTTEPNISHVELESALESSRVVDTVPQAELSPDLEVEHGRDLDTTRKIDDLPEEERKAVPDVEPNLALQHSGDLDAVPDAELVFESVPKGKKKNDKKKQKALGLWTAETPAEASYAFEESREVPQVESTDDRIIPTEVESQPIPETSCDLAIDEQHFIEPEVEAPFLSQRKQDKKKQKGVAFALEDSIPGAFPTSVEATPVETEQDEFFAPKKVKGKGKKRQQKLDLWSETDKAIAHQESEIEPSTVALPESENEALELAKPEDTPRKLESPAKQNTYSISRDIEVDNRVPSNNDSPRDLEPAFMHTEISPVEIELPTTDDNDLVEPSISDHPVNGLETLQELDVPPQERSRESDAAQHFSPHMVPLPDIIDEDFDMLDPKEVIDSPLTVLHEHDVTTAISSRTESLARNFPEAIQDSSTDNTDFPADAAADDEWAPASQKLKKGKKGRKSAPITPPVQEEQDLILDIPGAFAADDREVEPIDEPMSHSPTVLETPQDHNINDNTAPEELEPPASTIPEEPEDEWATSSKKKGKNGKKNRQAPLPDILPAAESSPVVPVADTGEEAMSRGTPVEPPRAAEIPPAEEAEFWGPVTKKGKKGKKGNKASAPSTPPVVEPLEPIDTDFLENIESAASDVAVAAIDEDDEWGAVIKKGKKGKKAQQASTPNTPPVVEVPEPIQTDVPEEAKFAEPDEVATAVDEDEEWGAATKKAKKGKKGKNTPMASTPPVTETPELLYKKVIQEIQPEEPEKEVAAPDKDEEWGAFTKKGKKGKKGKKASAPSTPPVIEKPELLNAEVTEDNRSEEPKKEVAVVDEDEEWGAVTTKGKNGKKGKKSARSRTITFEEEPSVEESENLDAPGLILPQAQNNPMEPDLPSEPSDAFFKQPEPATEMHTADIEPLRSNLDTTEDNLLSIPPRGEIATPLDLPLDVDETARHVQIPEDTVSLESSLPIGKNKEVEIRDLADAAELVPPPEDDPEYAWALTKKKGKKDKKGKKSGAQTPISGFQTPREEEVLVPYAEQLEPVASVASVNTREIAGFEESQAVQPALIPLPSDDVEDGMDYTHTERAPMEKGINKFITPASSIRELSPAVAQTSVDDGFLTTGKIQTEPGMPETPALEGLSQAERSSAPTSSLAAIPETSDYFPGSTTGVQQLSALDELVLPTNELVNFNQDAISGKPIVGAGDTLVTKEVPQDPEDIWEAPVKKNKKDKRKAKKGKAASGDSNDEALMLESSQGILPGGHTSNAVDSMSGVSLDTFAPHVIHDHRDLEVDQPLDEANPEVEFAFTTKKGKKDKKKGKKGKALAFEGTAAEEPTIAIENPSDGTDVIPLMQTQQEQDLGAVTFDDFANDNLDLPRKEDRPFNTEKLTRDMPLADLRAEEPTVEQVHPQPEESTTVTFDDFAKQNLDPLPKDYLPLDKQNLSRDMTLADLHGEELVGELNGPALTEPTPVPFDDFAMENLTTQPRDESPPNIHDPSRDAPLAGFDIEQPVHELAPVETEEPATLAFDEFVNENMDIPVPPKTAQEVNPDEEFGFPVKNKKDKKKSKKGKATPDDDSDKQTHFGETALAAVGGVAAAIGLGTVAKYLWKDEIAQQGWKDPVVEERAPSDNIGDNELSEVAKNSETIREIQDPVEEEFTAFTTKKGRKDKKKSKSKGRGLLSDTSTPRDLSPDRSTFDPVSSMAEEPFAISEVDPASISLPSDERNDFEPLKPVQAESHSPDNDQTHQAQVILSPNVHLGRGTESPPAGVDFAATVAAGLEDSGFDPAMVVNDPDFHRPPSRSRALEEPDFDELPLQGSRRSSRHSSRRQSRSASVEPNHRTVGPQLDVSEAKPPPKDDNEFAAILAAGLQGSGFDPDIVRDDATYVRRQSPLPEDRALDESEGFSALHERPKKGKKGRKEQLVAPLQESEAVPGDTIDPVAIQRDFIEPVSEPVVMQAKPLEQEEEWALPVKKGKKGKKGSKVSSKAASGLSTPTEPIAPMDHVALEPMPEAHVVKDVGADITDEWAASIKKGKKAKKSGKSTPRDTETDSHATDLSDAIIDRGVSEGMDLREAIVDGSRAMGNQEEERDAPSKKKSKKDKKGKKANKEQDEQQGSMADALMAAGGVAGLAAVAAGVMSGKAESPNDNDLKDTSKRAITPNTLTRDLSPENLHHSPSKVQSLFPGLERVKRKAPPRIQSGEHVPKRLSIGDGDAVHDRLVSPVSPSGDGRDDLLPIPEAHSVQKQISAQDLTQPTWSFPTQRDSAIEAESPLIPSSPPIAHEAARDCGYHDAPVLPHTPLMSGTQQDRTIQESSPPSHGLNKTPIKVQVEVDPHWDVSVSQETPAGEHSQQLHADIDDTHVPILRSFEEYQADEYPFPEVARTTVSPNAVESTSRDRGSALLFQSSPSQRESPDYQLDLSPARPISPPRNHHERASQALSALEDADIHMHDSPSVLKKEKHPLSKVTGPGITDSPAPKKTPIPSTPITHGRGSSLGLDTILETSPASPESPLAKKGRMLSDFGKPERESKAARRSATPERLRLQTPSNPGAQSTPVRSSAQAGTPESMVSVDDMIARRSWPAVDEDKETIGIAQIVRGDPSKRVQSDEHRRTPSLSRDLRKISPMGELRSPSVMSDRSNASLNRFKSPDSAHALSPNISRPMSSASVRSDRSLRRVHRSVSGDLRSASQRQEANVGAKLSDAAPLLLAGAGGLALASTIHNKGLARSPSMEGVFEGRGGAPESPMSPTRPPSVRKRQSMQIMDLESRMDQVVVENRMLQEAKTKAEQAMQEANQDREVHANTIRQATEAVASRDLAIQEKDMLISQLRNTLDQLQNEVSRLTEENAHLSAQHQELQATANQGHESLQTQNAHAHAQWQTTSRELEELKLQHQTLNTGMEQIVRDEIANALEDKDAEIQRLQEQLETAMEQIKILQRDILTTKQGESFLNVRDEDWFDSACQQLCTHVQQWVLRFSKFSDQKACRLSSDIKDVKIRDRLDDAVLDGSDVDVLLADRIKRRDVFMSVAMSMIWEYVFTRYLFGMDREQRQKLKTLEKTLNEVGPPSAVAQWRAITLTLLSKRELFVDQRNQDTEAVAHEIYGTLAKILPPPANLVQQCQDSLRKVVTLAVNLAVEMRCQRAEYIMLPPLRPEYDTNGDLVQKVNFNASLMNERSGETNDNDELESRAAVVKIVLFPLVVKKGDDLGEGEDEIVVCPAQVLVAKPSTNKKVVRVVSGPMDIDSPRRSMASIMPESNVI